MPATQLRIDGASPAPVGQPGKDLARVETILAKIDAAWRDFHDAATGLTDDQLHQSGVTGNWSVRDLIAHVTWWDQECIDHLPEIRQGIPPTRYSVKYGGLDAFNALMTERKAHLTLDEVRNEAAETHARLIDAIRAIPPTELMANDRLKRRIRLDTHGHYPIHTTDIRTWRERHGM